MSFLDALGPVMQTLGQANGGKGIGSQIANTLSPVTDNSAVYQSLINSINPAGQPQRPMANPSTGVAQETTQDNLPSLVANLLKAGKAGYNAYETNQNNADAAKARAQGMGSAEKARADAGF